MNNQINQLSDGLGILMLFEQLSKPSDDADHLGREEAIIDSLAMELKKYSKNHFQELNSLSIGLSHGCREYLRDSLERGKIPFPDCVADFNFVSEMSGLLAREKINEEDSNES